MDDPALILRPLTVEEYLAFEVMVAEVEFRPRRDRFYYPDVRVVCTPGDDEDVVVRDPCLVVEVTSPDTARIGRGEKLDAERAAT